MTDIGDLSVDELRASGGRALGWIEQYLSEPGRFRVLPNVAPGDVRAKLPGSPPAHPESMETILTDFENVIAPALTHWNHPGFFGYFATSASIPGIIAELLCAAVDVKAMLWKTSPAATELEQVVTDWFRQMLGLDAAWWGMTTDTASMSTMLALAAARESRPELMIRERGMAGRSDLPVLRIYTSAHAHSSIEKGALALGIGSANVVKIGCDDAFRMRPDLLQESMTRDIAAGALPLACVATVGTTGVASVDPIPAIVKICKGYGAWLHVDAAYAGVVAILPERRSIFAGVDAADSLVVNPHKWLFTPMDCSVLYLRRREILSQAFSLVPEYLRTREDDEVVNYMDYGVQLGRRFRALKLWMIIRAFGVDGLAARIREHCEITSRLAARIAKTPGWVVMAPVHFGLVVFRYAPAGMTDAGADALNERVMHRVNAQGEVFLSHTKIGGRYAIRMSVGNIRSTQEHVERAWTLLGEAVARELSHD
jgi:aromatic-L-amino-acid decarboxylase